MSGNRGLRPLDPIFDPGKRLGAISVGNQGGGGGGGHPTFSWPGLLSFLDRSPAWPCTFGATYTSLLVIMPDGQAALDFDILQNGSVVDSVSASSTRSQTVAISSLVIAAGDDVQIEVTDFGAGTAIGLGVAFVP